MMTLWLNFHSLANESGESATYTNSGRIIHIKLLLRFCELVEKENSGYEELIITYDGRPVYVVSVMEFREGKVAHQTYYFGDPFEPPEWRSQWVERIQ